MKKILFLSILCCASMFLSSGCDKNNVSNFTSSSTEAASSVQSVPSPESGTANALTRPNLIKEIQKAELILEGTVTDISGPELIENHAYSRVTLEISEVLRGNFSSQSITLLQSGGTIDGVAYSNNDGFTCKKGQQLILILEKDGKNGYSASQYFVRDDQGCFHHYLQNEKFEKKDFLS